MVWAATLGLPLSLKSVGSILRLENQKMDEGKALIKYFSVPCTPTKVNGGRTRNLPTDDPEKWATFKRYNKRDVEVEMAIQKRLSKFPVPDFVWDEYVIDQEINDRGVRLDMDLVRQAIRMDSLSKEELTKKLTELTSLDNPNSVQQMKLWLSDNGLETDSLGKKEVARMIESAPDNLKEVLELRQMLAKSSVKKYQTMQRAVCKDGRARGMFMFYGANRTGRWAGRLVQLQNLPQNHLPDLAEARALVKSGDYDSVKVLYEDVPDTLSQLIRTAFIPKEGQKFYVADFSAIEARVMDAVMDYATVDHETVTFHFSRFLGYDKGPNGELVVNPEEAKTVRKIFRLFLQGMTPYGISKQLMADGDLGPAQNPRWNAGTVKRMLGNEKYKGCML